MPLRNYVIIRSEQQIHFKFVNFLFLSNSFAIETTRFETKMSKVYPHFLEKHRKNPTLWSGTYLYGLCRAVPTYPGTRIRVFPRNAVMDRKTFTTIRKIRSLGTSPENFLSPVEAALLISSATVV